MRTVSFKSVLFYFLFFISCSVFAQTSQLLHTNKIVDVYGQEWFNRMKNESPDLLILMDKYVSHGFYVRNVSEGKYAEFVPIETIPLVCKKDTSISVEQFLNEAASPDFNPLKYRYFSQKDAQVYKLKGANKIIYIIPQQNILSK